MRRLLFTVCLLLLVSQEVSAVDKAALRWARSRPRIDSIVIEGNHYLSDSEIRGHLYSRVRNLWLAVKGDRRSRVQRETLGRDTLEVKYLYLRNGFLGVRVQHSYEPVGRDSTALVRIVIDEGRQFRYGGKTVTGSYEEEFGWRLSAFANKLEMGEPVNPFGINDIKTETKTFLANRGYPYATVDIKVDTTGPPERCPVAVNVFSDSLVHFGDVVVKGAVNYPEYVALRELKIAPGGVYRREDILESQRRLFESGYYTTFQLRRAEQVSDRLNPDFVLSLRERKTRHMTFSAGAGQSTVKDLLWDVSGAFGQRNFLGSRRYELLADYSFSFGRDTRLITHRYRLRYTEPWFLGVRMPLAVTGQFEPRIKDPVQEFDKYTWSVSAVATKWYAQKIKVSLGLQYESINISGASDEIVAYAKTLEGNSERRKIYAIFRRDSRDDLFVPSRGSVTEFQADVWGGFLGGDDSFFKLQGSWSRYQIVWPGWIAATRLQGRWAEEYGKTECVPLDEALYVGGANTVRGFDENMLGPLIDKSTPAGARYTVVFNQEFRWKTVQIHQALPVLGGLFKSLPLWQSLFLDIGNGFSDTREMRFDNLAMTYGTGLQIMSPAGPIRVDYARVIKTDRFDFDYRWHFTILYAF